MPRLILIAALMAVLAGCGGGDRVASLAIRDAERQARQNEQLLELHNKVAQGSRDLVAADSASRETLAEVHQDLQAERSDLGRQRDQLEADRRTIAFQRRTDPLFGNAMTILAGLAAAAAPLALCWLLLRRASEPADVTTTAELLLDDLIADRPILRVDVQPVPKDSTSPQPLLDPNRT